MTKMIIDNYDFDDNLKGGQINKEWYRYENDVGE